MHRFDKSIRSLIDNHRELNIIASKNRRVNVLLEFYLSSNYNYLECTNDQFGKLKNR